jgi:hypothetical protein
MKHKICFVADCHYQNYTSRLKNSFLKKYIEYGVNNTGVDFIVTTNRPQDFEEYEKLGVIILDINKIRHDSSLNYEILPENPKGIYPSGFPWNLERFGLKKAAELGYNIVINIDSDVVFNTEYDAKNLFKYLNNIFEKNTVITNQAIFKYQKGSTNEIFHLHSKYIEHFNLEFEDNQLDSMDGPVIIYMGETPEDIISFYEKWDELTNFGYKKDYGFGYENIVCGNWSLCIPMSKWKLKWVSLPLTPHHKYEDRY